jgi:hypothetical protein
MVCHLVKCAVFIRYFDNVDRPSTGELQVVTPPRFFTGCVKLVKNSLGKHLRLTARLLRALLPFAKPKGKA